MRLFIFVAGLNVAVQCAQMATKLPVKPMQFTHTTETFGDILMESEEASEAAKVSEKLKSTQAMRLALPTSRPGNTSVLIEHLTDDDSRTTRAHQSDRVEDVIQNSDQRQLADSVAASSGNAAGKTTPVCLPLSLSKVDFENAIVDMDVDPPTDDGQRKELMRKAERDVPNTIRQASESMSEDVGVTQSLDIPRVLRSEHGSPYPRTVVAQKKQLASPAHEQGEDSQHDGVLGITRDPSTSVIQRQADLSQLLHNSLELTSIIDLARTMQKSIVVKPSAKDTSGASKEDASSPSIQFNINNPIIFVLPKAND